MVIIYDPITGLWHMATDEREAPETVATFTTADQAIKHMWQHQLQMDEFEEVRIYLARVDYEHPDLDAIRQALAS